MVHNGKSISAVACTKHKLLTKKQLNIMKKASNEESNNANVLLGEVYLVKKGKKFMKGHGYSTLNGYKFNWTFDKNEARKMEYSTANSLAISSGGSVLHFA